MFALFLTYSIVNTSLILTRSKVTHNLTHCLSISTLFGKENTTAVQNESWQRVATEVHKNITLQINLN